MREEEEKERANERERERDRERKPRSFLICGVRVCMNNHFRLLSINPCFPECW